MVFSGVEQCIPILHGSQGCSTYIRRYMISHFREPVDIASSSFTEEDTVYGGARNLALGIQNLIRQYEPDVIGVATTCLSETIGEDIAGMVAEIERGLTAEMGTDLVHVSTPSYTGTHTDGFHATCLALVKRFARAESASKRTQAKRINLFPGMVSPADLRYYRELIEDFGMGCTMIPDYSDTLDGPGWEDYHKLAQGGTPRAEIAASSTATASLECGALLANAPETAGTYLEQKFSVRNHRCGLPIGIRATDTLVNALEAISGISLSKKHAAERGRLVDSLFDAHKYLFGKTVAIYGDPDLVVGLAAFVNELGMIPIICATGGKATGFKSAIDAVTLNNEGKTIEILTAADHVKIFERCEARQPDLILGSSKGYTISKKLKIPLLRIGFPIHDRMGGQRILHIGYRGAQSLFVPSSISFSKVNKAQTTSATPTFNNHFQPPTTRTTTMNLKDINIDNHPCFNKSACHSFGRVHLAVAPRCNVSCNFCNRKFDCVNESRPGVTSGILTPKQALEYTKRVLGRSDKISVVGIAGPGDPYANPEETMETFSLVREAYPNTILCVATNGIDLLPHVPRLAELKVSHVTITINGVDPQIVSKIYAWARSEKKVYRGEALGEMIVEKQLAALKSLREYGIIPKVNSIIIPGVNDHHIVEIAKVAEANGAEIMNCIPMIPVADTPFESLGEPDAKTVARVRIQSGEHVRQMLHCARCRADAVGHIGEGIAEEFKDLHASAGKDYLDNNRRYVAIASMEGALVNQHLGEAGRFLIFEKSETSSSGYQYKEFRRAPEAGGGNERWAELARVLSDCKALVVNAAGDKPKRILIDNALPVVEMEGMIEDALDCVFNDKPIPKRLQREFKGCGSGVTCKGQGMGCA